MRLLSVFLITIVSCNAYIFIDEQLFSNWEVAEEQCQVRYGTHLASIHSEQDIKNIMALLGDNDCKYAWIGLHRNENDKTKFEWVDGTELNKIAWHHLAGFTDAKHGDSCVLFLEYGYYYYPCHRAAGPTEAICNGQQEVDEQCCTANLPKQKYYNICPKLESKNTCLKIDTNTGDQRCKWINCNAVGYCQYKDIDDETQRSKARECKDIRNKVDCEGLDFCEWKYGQPSEQYFIDLNDEIMVNDNLNNIILSDITTTDYQIRWSVGIILIFISFGSIFVCYQIYKYMPSNKNGESLKINQYGSVL